MFVGTSIWWLTQDDRVPDWDSGIHMVYAVVAHNELAAGQLSAPFTDFNTYPPLVHLVGALSISVFGVHPMAMIVSSNLVFVPLLALGCFGVGRIAYGPRSGLLAAVFALGTPMFVSMMHEYDLDPPQAALIAVSVWGILASRRFERPGIAALAGGSCGLALLTKETSVVFLAGILLVALMRGGWRRPLGLLAFTVGVGVVAGPWYLDHLDQLRATFGSIGELAPNAVQAPPRWSWASFGWYFWNLLNQQIFAPFFIAFAIGGVLAVRSCLRRPLSADNVLPELLGGGIVSYLGMSYLIHKDPRYTLPALVYVAVLATGWIGTMSRPGLRRALAGAVIAVAVINFAGVSGGLGGPIRIALPGATNSIIYPSQVTLYETEGWVRGGPEHDAAALDMLRGLRRAGIRDVEFDPSVSTLDFNTNGMIALTASAGMVSPPVPLAAAYNAYVLRRAVRPGDPPPCQRLNDGSGVYVIRGNPGGLDAQLLRNPGNAAQRYELVCPGRRSITWP